MKFENIVVTAFLSMCLIYAICYRSNLITYKPFTMVETADSTHTDWKNTICFNGFEISADSAAGITIRDTAESLLSVDSVIKPEAIHLDQNQVIQGDTLDLLYCRLISSDSVRCFRIMADGSLKKISL